MIINSINTDTEWCNWFFGTPIWTATEVHEIIIGYGDTLKSRAKEIAELQQKISDLEFQIECIKEDDGWRWNE